LFILDARKIFKSFAFQNTVESAYKSAVWISKRGSYIRTAPLSEALISGLCQYVKHRRKKWGIGKRLLKADRSFIRSSYKWTRLYLFDEMAGRAMNRWNEFFTDWHDQGGGGMIF
jgi:hypothetical protein